MDDAPLPSNSTHNNDPSSLLNLTGSVDSSVSPLEQEVLDEYERLVGNMTEVSPFLHACLITLCLMRFCLVRGAWWMLQRCLADVRRWIERGSNLVGSRYEMKRRPGDKMRGGWAQMLG